MDYTQQNIYKITQYFENSCKAEGEPLRIGVETEHFLIDKVTGKQAVFEGGKGIEELMKRLAPHFEEKAYRNGLLIGLGCKDFSISLEPSCQFESSLRPAETICEIEKLYDEFTALAKPLADELGYKMVCCGYHPTELNKDMKLIPKCRYKFMDRYFEKIGTKGRFMMRSTASVQVSIDYYSEEDFRKKYKSLYILGPVLSFMTDNTPVYEGKKNEVPLLRTVIWRNVDGARVDIFKYMDFNNFGFKDYAEFVYNVPLIVDIQTGSETYTEKTAAEIYCEKELEKKDIEHILSMVFPMVRLKSYIEIRFADSMSKERTLSYAALIKGLYKQPEIIYNYIETLDVKNFEDIKNAEDEIIKNGANANVYGRTVGEIAEKLKEISRENLEEEGMFLC